MAFFLLTDALVSATVNGDGKFHAERNIKLDESVIVEFRDGGEIRVRSCCGVALAVRRAHTRARRSSRAARSTTCAPRRQLTTSPGWTSFD
jgi:hypothetical protein